MVHCSGMAVVAAGRRSAATADGLGEAAAHAARAAVRRPLAGYDHPALARSRRRNDLLHLFADHGGAFATDRIGLRAIRLEHDRLDELRRGRTGRRAARGGSATGDDVTAWRRHRHSGAPHLALASIAASSGTYTSGCAAGIALVIHGTILEEYSPIPKAVMLLHGFTAEQLAELVRVGFAATTIERVVGGAQTVEVTS
jgi:hypothetical protein